MRLTGELSMGLKALVAGMGRGCCVKAVMGREEKRSGKECY